MRLKKVQSNFLGGNVKEKSDFFEESTVCFENLKTNFLGKNAVYFETIDSTQSEIFRMIANENIENGTLVYADFQTNGLGTHGRKWLTDEANNVAFSFYFEAGYNVRKAFWFD